jgi:hypothetical protein
LAITAVLLVLFIYLQVRLTYNGRLRSSYGILMKQLINHFQLVSLISLTDLAWTPDIKNLFKFQEYFSFLSQEFINLDCFLQDIGSNLLMNKIVVTVIIPLFLSFVAFAFWILLFIWQRLLRGRIISIQSLVNRTLLCSLIIIYLLFPELIRMCLLLLDCVKVSDNPKIRLLSFSPEIICWDDDHKAYIFVGGLPGLIFWGLVTPMLILILLLKNENEIRTIILKETSKVMISIAPSAKKITNQTSIIETRNEIKNLNNFANFLEVKPPKKNNSSKSINYNKNLFVLDEIRSSSKVISDKEESFRVPSMSSRGELDISNNKEISMGALLKFLYKGYRREYYYWEIVIIFKKFTLLFISSFSDMFPENSKAIILLITLTLFILIQKRFQPFEGQVFNNIEFLSLIIGFLTANFGVMLFSEDLKIISQFFLSLIILLNIIFVIVWVWAICYQYKRDKRARKIHCETKKA